MGITADFSGAIKKTQTLLNMGKATKYNLTDWAAETVRQLKQSAQGMKKIQPKRGGGALARSVGMKISMESGNYKLVIGTGIGTAAASQTAQKYAHIQDVGGTTHPTVTPRMRSWAWAMFYKTGLDKYKGIALTKKKKLDVKIPASRWFSLIWERRFPALQAFYLNDRQILWTAEKMAGVAHAE